MLRPIKLRLRKGDSGCFTSPLAGEVGSSKRIRVRDESFNISTICKKISLTLRFTSSRCDLSHKGRGNSQCTSHPTVLDGLSTVILLFATLWLTCGEGLALKVGVTAGPHAEIATKVKALAKAKSLTVDLIEFNDFILPNAALASGDLDLNSYQHESFLKSQIDSRGYKLKSIAKTVVMPMGVYSKKIKSLSDLPTGAKITIPNDPTNGGRALKLLAKNGLIELKDDSNPSPLDMTANPKNISFVEIEAPLLPKSLDDVDAAVINTDWVLQAGLDPKSAIAQEDKDSPYVNVIAVREDDENREDIRKFIHIYQSDEIRTFIETTYKGAVIPAW